MQINRLFEMVYLLLNEQTLTANTLATHFEVSPRTIYRDVEILSSAGIPIYMTKGKGGGISLLPEFVLNKAVLTDTEKSDILSAMQAFEAVNLEQTNGAINKLSSLFGNNKADWVEVEFSAWENGNDESSLFSLIKQSILEKRLLMFTYHSSNGCEARTIEPLKLCFKGHSWYLYGYCQLRNDHRFFKLRRIKDCEILSEHFTRVAPVKIFEEVDGFNDTMVNITLKISKEMAYRVYDEFPQCQKLPDGNFQVELTMPNGQWVYYYLATFGECCEVISPEDIRTEVKTKLEKTLQLYL